MLEISSHKKYPTGLSENDPLFLTSTETLSIGSDIPGSPYGTTLKDPTQGEDNIRHNQNDDAPLKRLSQSLADRNAEEK